MNKVITINLNGNAYQLEEDGYELLRAYLDGAARRLEGNPDRDEIIADIEQAIADKARAVLGAFKTVVNAKEVRQIVDEMGPVENAAADTDEGAAGPAPGRAAASDSARAEFPGASPVRRLYKIFDGAMLGGVCNGIAAYVNLDVTLVRIAFVLLTLVWGTGMLVYLILYFLLPTAGTAAEKAAAQGMPATAQEFIRRARQGYYEGMKTFSDREAHREWRRNFKREMRGWRRTFQHEMRAGAWQWRHNWSQHWAPGFHPGAGSWLALPLVSLLRGGLILLWLASLVSLLTTGAIFGLALPSGMPLWAACVLSVVAYKIVAWPIKAIRRGYYYSAGAGPHFASPFIWMGEAVIGVGFLVVFLWLATHHWSEVHAAIAALPPMIHQGIDAVREWWSRP